jgi:hypothetical protein
MLCLYTIVLLLLAVTVVVAAVLHEPEHLPVNDIDCGEWPAEEGG